jgi:hypothetical protein
VKNIEITINFKLDDSYDLDEVDRVVRELLYGVVDRTRAVVLEIAEQGHGVPRYSASITERPTVAYQAGELTLTIDPPLP